MDEEQNWQADAVSTIATALNNVRKKVEKIERTGSNAHFNYNYVEEGALLAQLRKYLIEEGLILTPEVPGEVQTFLETGHKKNMVLVVFVQSYRLAHTSGAVWPWPIQVVASGQDVNDKATWKASTGASKYALMRLLQLATGDDPEQDKGIDRGSPSAAAPSSAPPKRSRPATHPARRASNSGSRGGGQQDVSGLIDGLDPEDLVSDHDGLAKQCGIYAAVFKASERVHGKAACEADSSVKFSCMDAYLESQGIRSAKQMRVGHIPELLQFAADWDPHAPMEADNSSAYTHDEIL